MSISHKVCTSKQTNFRTSVFRTMPLCPTTGTIGREKSLREMPEAILFMAMSDFVSISNGIDTMYRDSERCLLVV